jgi:hypothetical protein
MTDIQIVLIIAGCALALAGYLLLCEAVQD